MITRHNKYQLPDGYTLLQCILRARAFLKDPVKWIAGNMNRFGGTYAAAIGFKRKLILTQHPGFISHVLKENHKNYQKSDISTDAGARFLGNGILFSNGAFWLQQRRLIQPAFHREKYRHYRW